MTNKLPADLLSAISQLSGRVVLVVGVGCSAEPPTSLPLSGELAASPQSALGYRPPAPEAILIGAKNGAGQTQ